MSGEFIYIGSDGNTYTVYNTNDIPDDALGLVKFMYDLPTPPHTEYDHQQIEDMENEFNRIKAIFSGRLGLPVVRKGDANIGHCSAHSMEEGSTSWFIDGKGMVGTGHSCTTHLIPPSIPPCPPHKPQAGPPNRGWYVEGRLIAALGDGIPGCTSHAQGSPNWFIS